MLKSLKYEEILGFSILSKGVLGFHDLRRELDDQVHAAVKKVRKVTKEVSRAASTSRGPLMRRGSLK